MSAHKDVCFLVKDIYYEGTVRGLTTEKMRQLLIDNGVDDKGYRRDLCKRIRENDDLKSKIDNYAPDYSFYIVGYGRLTKDQVTE